MSNVQASSGIVEFPISNPDSCASCGGKAAGVLTVADERVGQRRFRVCLHHAARLTFGSDVYRLALDSGLKVTARFARWGPSGQDGATVETPRTLAEMLKGQAERYNADAERVICSYRGALEVEGGPWEIGTVDLPFRFDEEGSWLTGPCCSSPAIQRETGPDMGGWSCGRCGALWEVV